MSTREHWDEVYRSKSPDSVSWYRPRLERSLAWIDPWGRVVIGELGRHNLRAASGPRLARITDVAGRALLDAW